MEMMIKLSNKDIYICILFLMIITTAGTAAASGDHRLRFGTKSGRFKIVQVADMHYADGQSTPCENVLPSQEATCSDFNTTAFLYRVLRTENPDLVVFTGDNIYQNDATDPAKSMDMAFEPVVALKLPWAAVLGNHDQPKPPHSNPKNLSREGVMRYITNMPYTLSRLNPDDVDHIDGFGNYYIGIAGPEGSSLVNMSVLNLYFLDSGDYSNDSTISYYDWIKPSQEAWFQNTSSQLQKNYKAPGLVYFHIPLPEYKSFDRSNFTGVKQEPISSPSFNSGFFATMVEASDVKAVFTGHDHLNDFCGNLTGIQLCYAGGFGYHAYGSATWPRRTRVVEVSLEDVNGQWGGVESIKTWKRLDDEKFSMIDSQILWSKKST